MKKLLCVCMSICLLLALLPMTAFADADYCNIGTDGKCCVYLYDSYQKVDLAMPGDVLSFGYEHDAIWENMDKGLYVTGTFIISDAATGKEMTRVKSYETFTMFDDKAIIVSAETKKRADVKTLKLYTGTDNRIADTHLAAKQLMNGKYAFKDSSVAPKLDFNRDGKADAVFITHMDEPDVFSYSLELTKDGEKLAGKTYTLDTADMEWDPFTSCKHVKIKLISSIKLTLKTVKVKKSAKKLVLSATVKECGKAVKNKKVTFKFNGKKLTAKTNKKGVAKVTIKKGVLKKLKVGKKVAYSVTYAKKTVKKTAKVRK